MASFFGRMRSSLGRQGVDDGWVEPGNAVTRRVTALESGQTPPPAAAGPLTVEIPPETLAQIEAAAAEEEAAARAFAAAREAALPSPARPAGARGEAGEPAATDEAEQSGDEPDAGTGGEPAEAA